MMKPLKPLILCALGAALWLGIAQPGLACKYCQMAAGADPDGYRAGSGTYSGGFPLEASIDKFQPAAPEAPLTVITQAADLPRPASRAAAVSKPTAPAASAPIPVAKAPAPVSPAMQASARAALGGPAAHLLDGGLLGLAAMGGVFFWRTRRPSGAVR